MWLDVAWCDLMWHDVTSCFDNVRYCFVHTKSREYPMKLVAFEPFGMLFPVSLQSRLDARSWYLQRCRLQNPQFWILNQPFSYFRFPIKHEALFCTVPILVFIRVFPWVSTHIERHAYVLSQLHAFWRSKTKAGCTAAAALFGEFCFKKTFDWL